MRRPLLDLFFAYLLPTAAIGLAIAASYEPGATRDVLVALANGSLLAAAIFARHPVLVRLEVILVGSSVLNLCSHVAPIDAIRIPCAAIAALGGLIWLKRTDLLDRVSAIAALGFGALMIGWAWGASETATLGYTIGAGLLAVYALVDYVLHRHFIALYWLLLNSWFFVVGIVQLISGTS